MFSGAEIYSYTRWIWHFHMLFVITAAINYDVVGSG